MELIDQLAEHKALGSVPRQELEWLVAHGDIHAFARDEQVAAKGTPIESLYILLSGRIAIFVDRGSGADKMMEWRGGEVSGLLPYSRLTSPPGNTFAQEPTTTLQVHRDHFPEMIRECPAVTAILVHTMLDRARVFRSNELHAEKLISLGKLSAGLAHELNNPASAIERSAGLLDRHLDEAERAARTLGASRLSDAQLAAVDTLRACCMNARVHGVLSPIEEAEREDTISDWLQEHHLDAAIAGPLGETGVTLDALNRFAAAVDGPALDAVLRWAAAESTVRGLASEIQEAAMRISGLVTAIKGFTHMDQATAAEPVDLPLGLTNTVDVLKSKARKKSVAVTVAVEPNLPRVRGFIGELNQIWANLMDNALDAVPQGGRVEVKAIRERDRVVVSIIDNGTGITPEVREHMFEPFFTTKPIGEGTGLGLDIVRRLVLHNEASIDVASEPGRTQFRVSLPLADGEPAGTHP
jgi:signal transduction histidine kinase